MKLYNFQEFLNESIDSRKYRKDIEKLLNKIKKDYNLHTSVAILMLKRAIDTEFKRGAKPIDSDFMEKIEHNMKIKINESFSEDLLKAIEANDPDMSYSDFAKGVARVLKDEYGKHNFKPFLEALKKELK